MQGPRPRLTPLNGADLERLALRYVERYATTRARLADYLRRKLRERGWGGEGAPDPDAIAARMADRGYVDDRLYAETKANAMTRRGLGARRVHEALRHAGIEAEDVEPLEPVLAEGAAASALAFARRKRIGPYAREQAEPKLREKQVAAMVRAGHKLSLSWTIVRMAPGESAETLLDPADD